MILIQILFFGLYTLILFGPCEERPSSQSKVNKVLLLALRPNTSPLGAVFLSEETRPLAFMTKQRKIELENKSSKDTKKSSTEEMCHDSD